MRAASTPLMVRWPAILVLAAAGLLALSGGSGSLASSAPYRLDETFGAGGVTVADFDPGNRALALVLQPDGKIVLTGQDDQGNLSIARLLPDGSPDKDFAIDGLYASDLVRRGEDVIVQPNGKIVASGFGEDHLVRLLEDGAPDQSFGGDGVTGSQFFNPDDPDESEKPEMERLIPWPGNTIIVGGTIDYGPYFFTFARYTDAGQLDEAFGDEGQVQTDFSPAGDNFDQRPFALTPYDDTHFVAAGFRDVADGEPEASVIAMYDADGTPTDSFGDDGSTTTQFFAEFESIRELLLQPEGRILAIGDGLVDTPNGFKDTLFIARYNADGILDDDFGTNGAIIYDREGSWVVEGAALLEDGSIVIGGTHENHAFFAKFDAEGTPDPAFGIDGWILLDVEVQASQVATDSQVLDIAVDEDNNIYGAGAVSASGGQQMAVFKLTNIPLPPVGDERTWGDMDCDGDITTRDNQALLRKVLSQPPLSQTEPCPDIGNAINVFIGDAGLPGNHWGNLDCDVDGITSRDSQALLRNVLTQAALSQSEPCPDIGATVNVNVVP